MKYSPGALTILGYTRRSLEWNDFVSKTMATWYKFSADHSESKFVWVNNEHHRNSMGITHGGALMTYMDYCMSAAIWDLTGGRSAMTIELNNKFIKPARIKRWLFASVKPIAVGDTIELEGEIRANDPTGMIVLQSYGKFTLPRQPKMLDNDS
ncbi:PaaI HGG motif-containing thioesterase, possibly involved in aromatic compounds catabolism [uncultured Caudovirales phage]|uniref:PaaI HGG motif-containing thioesterase, possibly involved in aromatic compounds catabolism n=1 Tax=uncultured Caudovirales phage TaxID=2100421 RepID=A0A6J5T9Z4_9CAUD|nr:PaaI HGG motif-containing thioesterase, possibly involved in aromatic compounds catabolism [uncultured Caudovirales phage]